MPIDTGSRNPRKRYIPPTRTNPAIRPSRPARAYQRTIAPSNVSTPPRVERAITRAPAALARVQAAYSHPGTIEGLSPDLSEFAVNLAKYTDLLPITTGAWTLQEGGHGGSDYNVLNIGTGFNEDINRQFSTPKRGARLTAAFLRGEAFGASPGIRNILPAARGKSPAQQIAAIANSGWAGDPAYGQHLQRAAQSISYTPGQQPRRQDLTTLHRAGVSPKAPRIPGTPTLAAAPANPVQVKKQVTRYRAAISAMKGIQAEQLPYVWGGGHVPGKIPTGIGLDCSASVRAVLQRAGYNPPPMVASQFESYGKPGPGALTIYAKGDHVLMSVNTKNGEKFFGTSASNPGGGPGWISKDQLPAGYLSQFVQRHIPGLGKKTAATLGVAVAQHAEGLAGGVSGGLSTGGGVSGAVAGTSSTAPKLAAPVASAPAYPLANRALDPIAASPVSAASVDSIAAGLQNMLGGGPPQQQSTGFDLSQFLKRRYRPRRG